MSVHASSPTGVNVQWIAMLDDAVRQTLSRSDRPGTLAELGKRYDVASLLRGRLGHVTGQLIRSVQLGNARDFTVGLIDVILISEFAADLGHVAATTWRHQSGPDDPVIQFLCRAIGSTRRGLPGGDDAAGDNRRLAAQVAELRGRVSEAERRGPDAAARPVRAGLAAADAENKRLTAQLAEIEKILADTRKRAAGAERRASVADARAAEAERRAAAHTRTPAAPAGPTAVLSRPAAPARSAADAENKRLAARVDELERKLAASTRRLENAPRKAARVPAAPAGDGTTVSQLFEKLSASERRAKAAVRRADQSEQALAEARAGMSGGTGPAAETGNGEDPLLARCSVLARRVARDRRIGESLAAELEQLMVEAARAERERIAERERKLNAQRMGVLEQKVRRLAATLDETKAERRMAPDAARRRQAETIGTLEEKLTLLSGTLEKAERERDEHRGETKRLRADLEKAGVAAERRSHPNQTPRRQDQTISILGHKIKRLASSLESAERERKIYKREAERLASGSAMAGPRMVLKPGIDDDDPDKGRKLSLLKDIFDQNMQMRRHLARKGSDGIPRTVRRISTPAKRAEPPSRIAA